MIAGKVLMLALVSLLAVAMSSVIVYWTTKSVGTSCDTTKDVLKREAGGSVGAVNVLSILLFFFFIVTKNLTPGRRKPRRARGAAKR
jgi:hypothetical protein